MVMAAPMGIVERYYDVADMLELRVLDLDYVGNSTLQLMRLQIDDSPTLLSRWVMKQQSLVYLIRMSFSL